MTGQFTNTVNKYLNHFDHFQLYVQSHITSITDYLPQQTVSLTCKRLGIQHETKTPNLNYRYWITLNSLPIKAFTTARRYFCRQSSNQHFYFAI